MSLDLSHSPDGSAPSNLSVSLGHNNLYNQHRTSPSQGTSPAVNSDLVEETNRDGKVGEDIKLGSKKREVYRFQSDWMISSVCWANLPGESFNLAISSFIEDYTNWVQIISLEKDAFNQEIESVTSFKHPYPTTKMQFGDQQLPHLLATSADYLRLWRVENLSKNPSFEEMGSSGSSHTLSSGHQGSASVKLESLLKYKPCAPLTSFDWVDQIIVTASVDTTCAVWDIETSKLVDRTLSSSPESITCDLRSQIIAHNHEVYDVSFSRSGSGRDVFVTAGGDGSVRLFDLRRLSTSTMLYEMDKKTPSDRKALVRACCNKQRSNYVSAFAISSQDILILDTRFPGQPVAVLGNHNGNLNSMSWAPHSAHHICSAGDDQQALIWELSKLPDQIDQPLLAYRAKGKINVISWGAHPDWIAIGFKNYLELLRV